MNRRLLSLLAACLLVIVFTLPAGAYVVYDTHVTFLEVATKDLLKLLPRAMGKYIYQNRIDYLRGATFMTRDIRFGHLGKLKDLEEIRREAFNRLHRDIPYCVQALKGGDIKLDTAPGNLAGRLGMIMYSIILLKMPEFPDLEYLERFSRTFDEAIVEDVIDVWMYYDGYGDFHSLGELMERLKPADMPAFKHVRNEDYPPFMKQDVYAMFRAPDKFEAFIVLTNRHLNDIYNNIINDVMDAFVYIWKCSGMDLQHPSYAAPPGTVISRPSRRRLLSAGVLNIPSKPTPTQEIAAPEAAEGGAPAPGAGTPEQTPPRGESPEGGAPPPRE